MAEQTYDGGCLCGAVRYRATGAAHRPHYTAACASAASARRSPPAWVNFPLAGFAYTAGEPAYYRSSPELRRGFCPTCGASICTMADGDAYVYITLAGLDDPARIAPALHMWTSSRVLWLEIADDLPRHAGQA
jgi:hypothetical protein